VRAAGNPAALARAIVAANSYLTLATADVDSTAAISTGQAVYVAATAERVTGVALADGIERFSERSLAAGGRAWALDEVAEGAPLGLYRATASEHWILDEGDRRPGDHRIPVRL
jgi:hypothetical protein